MKAYLVDGTYELFRAFYGGPPSTSPDGMEVGAVRTLARSLLGLLRDPSATHVGCAFDHVIRSFRNDLFDGYKTEEGIDPALFAQFHLAEDASRALGIRTWPMIELEADDAIATMAAVCARDARLEQVVLCSPDKDLAQCVSSDRVVMLDRMRRTTLTEAGVVEKFGVPPKVIPDYLALVGDAADGIPGIPGFGAKSARVVLAAFGSIEGIPEDWRRWGIPVRGAERLAMALNAEREEAALYRTLATLRLDGALDTTVDDLEWRGADAALLAPLAARLGDDELVQRAADVATSRGVATT